MRYTYPGLIDFELTSSSAPSRRGVFSIYFKVYEQDSAITCSEEREPIFQCSNGMRIGSWVYVELLNNDVCLIGRDPRDDNANTKYFDSAEKRDTYEAKVLFAFAEMAAKKGFSLKSNIPEPEQLQLWD